jgi:4-hydroxy-2-oxoheptanedioate aldolase
MKNFRQWLSEKPYFLGPFVRIPRPEIIEILAFSGFDFVVADLEHGGNIMPDKLYPLLLAAEKNNIKFIVRTPGIKEEYCKSLLDLGVDGLQIPHIKTEKDARKAVSFSRFSPMGERGLCRFVRAAEFSNTSKENYLANANAQSGIILQIEGKEGLENIRDIVNVPGIDMIYIGPYDMSQSLGVIGQIWHETVVAAIKEIVAVCKKAGIHTGIFTDTPEGVQRWKELGITYINYRIDVELFLTPTKNHIMDIKNGLQ